MVSAYLHRRTVVFGGAQMALIHGMQVANTNTFQISLQQLNKS